MNDEFDAHSYLKDLKLWHWIISEIILTLKGSVLPKY